MRHLGEDFMRFILIFLILLISASNNADPLERYAPQNITKAVALATKLSNTEWNYKWKGHSYRFFLNADGTISKLESWKDVHWVVIGANEIILEGYTDKMHLIFDRNIKTFASVDWDGSKSSGVLIH